MIELNLLPDVKVEYIKAQRTRRLVLSLSLIASAAAIALVVLLFGISSVQKKQISSATTSVNNLTSTLQDEPNLNQILTVQNQLNSLTSLHNDKPDSSRVFGYLNELTPVTVSISNFTADFNAHTISVTGNADSLQTVNQFIDILKCTTFSTTSIGSSGSNNSSQNCDSNNSNSPISNDAFNGVVLSSFGLNNNPTSPDLAVSYTINFNFNPDIFNITDNVQLNIPSLVITRANSTSSSELFNTNGNTSSNGGSQ